MTRQVMKADFRDLPEKLAIRPKARFEVKLPPVTAGAFVRRYLRVLLATAEMDGLDVDWREEKGFLDSVFLIRMTGPGGLLARHLRRMAALEEGSRWGS